MKTAIDLTSFSKDFRGGKEQVVCNIIDGITAINPNHKLILFCYDDFCQKASQLAPDAEIVTFRRWNRTKALRSLYIRTFCLNKYLRDADLLLFPMYYTGFRLFKIPTVVIPHDIQFKSRPKHFGMLTRLKDRIFYYLDFKLRDHIVAISDFDRSEICRFYPQFKHKIKKIPNPIKVNIPKTKQDRKHILAVNIGFEHKNADVIIKAYSKVYKELGVPLILVGKLYDPIKIEELIEKLGLQDSVEITGYVSTDKLSEMMHNAWAYVTSSDYEGFGMPSAEAMLFRIPVVSSKQKALVEVTSEKALYYAPTNSADSLAECLLELKKSYPDDLYLDKMRDITSEKYDYRNIAGKYLDWFKKISTRVIYSDPMSYNNLAIYDKNILDRIKKTEICYACNSRIIVDINIYSKAIYNYSDHKSMIIKALSYMHSQFRLIRLARRFKAGAVHLQWSRMPGFDSFIINRLKRWYGIRFIYTSHDTFTHNKERSMKKNFLALMSSADYIFVHTQLAAADLKSYGLSKVSVINHGLLKLNEVYPAGKVNFEKQNKIVFSSLGYMEEYKGTDIILKAWLSSKKLMSNGNIQLIVAGVNRMSYIPDIPHGCNITYINKKMEDCEFTAWMQTSDVIVMPYRRISQSGLLLSAMAMGKNVVVNDVGEMSLPVETYKIGWVTDTTDYLEFATKLEEIVKEIEDNGLKIIDKVTVGAIDQYYSWDKTVDITEKIYIGNDIRMD